MHAQSARFLNPKYHFEKPQPEIRSAAFCFASLDAIPAVELARCIANLQVLADRYGGFVNKYDLTDKGLIALLLFGLPVNEGKRWNAYAALPSRRWKPCPGSLWGSVAVPCMPVSRAAGH